MDFTSCHGQPVRSERLAGKSAPDFKSVLAAGNPIVRVWIIVMPNRQASAEANGAFSLGTYTQRAAHMQLDRNCLLRPILKWFWGEFAGGLAVSPSLPVHIGVL